MIGSVVRDVKLFGKVLPDSYGKILYLDFIKKMQLDVTEVEAYRTVLKDLTNFEKAIFGKEDKSRMMVPRFVAGGYNLDPERRGFFLILEDISDSFEVRLRRCFYLFALYRISNFVSGSRFRQGSDC